MSSKMHLTGIALSFGAHLKTVKEQVEEKPGWENKGKQENYYDK